MFTLQPCTHKPCKYVCSSALKLKYILLKGIHIFTCNHHLNQVSSAKEIFKLDYN